jgi:hypothetical protein
VAPSTRSRRKLVPALDRFVRLAVRRFVSLLVLCGSSPQAILHEVARACARLEKLERAKGAQVQQEWADLGHALTLWFSEPEYLDRSGRPLPLPLYGDTLSIEALTRRVDPTLDPEEVLHYIERGGGLVREGQHYLAKSRVLIFSGEPRNARPLTGLFGLIKTLDHNLRLPKGGSGRLERFTRNPRVPLSLVPALENRARRLFAELLTQFDLQMHKQTTEKREDEPTVTLGVGLYSFEQDSPEKPGARRKSRKR